MKNEPLKLGDKLFRRVEFSGIWEYEVIEVRQTPEGHQYVIKSLACTHGWKCEMLIAEDDRGDLCYICMTNIRDDDDQVYWHKPGARFCRTKAQAKIDACKLFVQSAKNRVDEAKAQLAAAEKNAKEVDEMMKVALTEQEAE